jgi:hypothetical protein
MQNDDSNKSSSKFAGKAEVKWLVAIGILSAAVYITSLVEKCPHFLVWATGAFACVFALPLGLIVIAVILAGIISIFTPGGASAIPLFAWKGGVDELSSTEIREFQTKPPAYRFMKVYLYLAVNSLAGAVMTLLAFGALYVLMQFAQQQKH